MEDIIYTVILVVMAVAVVFMVARRSATGQKEFDERQLIIRGKAYKYGFFATLAALITVIFCSSVFGFDMLLLGGASCLFFGLTVFAVYCIWNDAFVSFNQKLSSYLVVGGIVIVANGSGIIKRLAEGEQLIDMLKDEFCMNMLSAATFAVIEITIVIKLIASRRENE